MADSGIHSVGFRVKRTTKFKRIFDIFRAKTGLEKLKFLYEGSNVADTQTPDDLDMLEDADFIDVFTEVTGGHSRA